MQSTTNGGKALDRAFSFLLWGNQEEERKGYAKALGKPVLLIGICLLFSGVIAVILPKDYAISIAVIFILFIAVICSIWLYKIQKRFS